MRTCQSNGNWSGTQPVCSNKKMPCHSRFPENVTKQKFRIYLFIDIYEE